MNKLLATIALAAVPLAAFSDVLVDQASATDPDGYISDAFSTSGSQNAAQTLADGFTLSAASTLSSITFYGSSEYYQNADLTNLASFQVRILDSSFASVYDSTVATSTLSAAATGQTNVGLGTEYALTLSGLNLDLAAGTYVLNVGGVATDPTSDGFVWSLGTGGNGQFYYNSFDGAGYQSSSLGDLAFTVEGTQAVPEPASIAVLGLGGVAMLRRRRRPTA